MDNNLHKKIQDVSNIVKNIEKNISIGYGNSGYKAVADADVIRAINAAD